MKKEKKQNTFENIINKMFEFAGHEVTYNDVKDRKDEWYHQWTMTKEQNDAWVLWGSDYIKQKTGRNKRLSEMEMNMICANYGLKID
jgi:hypothetical protein